MTLDEYERRFRRAGLPLFIEDYSATEDVFTRAYPLLLLVFFVQVLGAIDRDWSLPANVAAIAGGFAILLAGVALANRLRNRSAFAEPNDIEAPELAAFVLLPALLPLIFGGQVTSAIVTAAGNVVLLLVIYGVVGYGLLSIVRWTVERLLGQLARSFALLSRALPLLFLFAIVLFVNTEVWQAANSASDAELLGAMGLFVLTGVLFLAARLPREVEALERDVGEGPALSRRQRVNVGLVLFVGQGLQVLVVVVAVGAFFVAFGLLVITEGVQEGWIGRPPEHVAFGVTRELLQAAAAVAAVSGLNFAIAVLTDTHYREEFLDEVTGELRQTFAARVEYLAART